MTLKIAAKTNLIHCRPTPTVACLCFWPKNIVLIQLKLQRKTFKVLCLSAHRTLLMYFCSVLKTSKCQTESSRVVSQNLKKGYILVVQVLIVHWKCWHIPVAKVSLIGFGKIWNGFWQRIWLHFWGRADHTNFIVGIIPAASNQPFAIFLKLYFSLSRCIFCVSVVENLRHLFPAESKTRGCFMKNHHLVYWSGFSCTGITHNPYEE